MSFDADFLQKLEYLSIVSRRNARGGFFAQRRSNRPGSGIEFADYRDYSDGDDFRYLDWNVFARLDRPLIKRFHEEEDLMVTLFLDGSRSMMAGDPIKFDYARKITAALAYIALAELDRVGVVLFDKTIRESFPPIKGKDHFLPLFRFLENAKASGSTTDLMETMKEFLHRRERTGLAVIVSDFLDPAGFRPSIDLLRFHDWEPVLIQIFDATEANPSFRGDRDLIDRETGKRYRGTITRTDLLHYQKRFAEFMEEIHRYALANGIGHSAARTDLPFETLLLLMMEGEGTLR